MIDWVRDCQFGRMPHGSRVVKKVLPGRMYPRYSTKDLAVYDFVGSLGWTAKGVIAGLINLATEKAIRDLGT